MWHHLLPILLLLHTAVGCSDPGSVLGDAEIELGTGTIEFEPLPNGTQLTAIAGIQGGFHFNVHARARGIVPGDPSMPNLRDNPITRFAAFLDGERVDLELAVYKLGYQPTTDAFELPSGRLLVLDNDRVEELYGQEVVIEVRVEDVDGDAASAERTVIAVADPNFP